MILRFLSALMLIWLLGFIGYAMTLPTPVGATVTDAIIVPTGGGGRIERGLDMLRQDQSNKLLVTGVDPDVTPGEFAAEFDASARLMHCCITLGYDAADTQGNAVEASIWAAQNKIQSVRLVTTDWHMARAGFEISQKLPEGASVIQDAVPSRPKFGVLFIEYNKLIAAMIRRAWNDWV